jgi:hypothetical protein
MSKYRFKTEEEFKKEGLWYENHPQGWNMFGNMNKYLGQDVPEKFNRACDNKVVFHYDGWGFNSQDYILKESSFILPEKWCIKVTEENVETLGKWRDAGPITAERYITESWYLHTPKHGAKGYNEPRKDPEYTEITFEQFKQYVLTPSDDSKIVPEIKKEIFHKGDYIVTLDVEDGYNCAKRNYCFKQRVDYTGIYPAVDLKGSTGNGHGAMSFDKKELLKDWRYATKEEADEYERIGKPYDVTTLKSKEKSIPEYVECIRSGSEVITVGKIYNWPDPIDDKGYKRSITTLDGLVWGFKPSTKEAYEAQFVTKTPVLPRYVKCIKAYGCAKYGEIFDTSDEDLAKRKLGMCWHNCLITLKRLNDVFIAYDESKWSDLNVMYVNEHAPIEKEKFIDNVQSVNVTLRTKKKTIKF